MTEKVNRPVKTYIISVLLFLGFILIAHLNNVKAYVNDSITILIVLTLLFLLAPWLYLRPWILLFFSFSFALHNMGVFGFYNVSPIFLQWDHVTHFFGQCAAAIFVYNYVHARGFFKTKKRIERGVTLCLIILASLGFGVFVEFMEFFGYLFVGEGMGIFGHGLGDINTEFINSEWFNTMFDFIYNLIGSVVGVIFMHVLYKQK